MDETHATGLAKVLDGTVIRTMPGSRSWGVQVIGEGGRAIDLEATGGWAYRNAAARDAYHGAGDASGLIEAWAWGSWDGSRGWANMLATLLGPKVEAWNSGGNLWLVGYMRPDGKFAVIGEEGAMLYASRAAELDGDTDAFEWVGFQDEDPSIFGAFGPLGQPC